jgi:hypothetical protein
MVIGPEGAPKGARARSRRRLNSWAFVMPRTESPSSAEEALCRPAGDNEILRQLNRTGLSQPGTEKFMPVIDLSFFLSKGSDRVSGSGLKDKRTRSPWKPFTGSDPSTGSDPVQNRPWRWSGGSDSFPTRRGGDGGTGKEGRTAFGGKAVHRRLQARLDRNAWSAVPCLFQPMRCVSFQLSGRRCDRRN